LSGLNISSAENSKARPHPDAGHRNETRKLDYIDALRGIAALSIVIYHIYATIGSITDWAYPIQIMPERFISLTLAGIPLFFIISAFTLYLSLKNKAGEKRKFLKFYLRRFFRIAPLFYYKGSAEGHEYPNLQVGDEVNPCLFFALTQNRSTVASFKKELYLAP